MPELLLLNPAPRRRRSSKKAKRRTVARAAAPRRARRVRRNPSAVPAVRRATRRRIVRANPKRRSSRRARRNPISMKSFSVSNVAKILKGAALGGVGAIGVEYAMNQIKQYLPDNMQPVPGEVGLYDAIKAGATIIMGRLLSKATKGMSEKMAEGALTVQAYNVAQILVAKYAPAVSAQTAVNGHGIGYASPNAIVRGNNRISPIMRLNRFTPKGTASPLLARAGGNLGRFTSRGTASPLLSSADSVRNREGVMYR